jgi:hypothetical protein
MAQTKNLEFVLKSSIFDRPRQLTLASDFIAFDDNDLVSSPPTRLLTVDLTGIRFGVKSISGIGLKKS